MLEQICASSKEIVLYCHSGRRSRELCEQFNGKVPTLMHSLAGGIRTWLERSYPVIFPESA